MLKVSRFALCYRECPCSHMKLWSTPPPFLLNPWPSASQPAFQKLQKFIPEHNEHSPSFHVLPDSVCTEFAKIPPSCPASTCKPRGKCLCSVVSVALLFLDPVNTMMSILRNKEYKSCHLRSHTTETPSREEHRILHCHVTAHGSFSGSWS